MTQEFQIAPFTADHLDAAATLLAQRQTVLRAARPELSARYTEPAGCRPLLDALVAREGSHGVVGIRDGEVVGFLVGFPRYEPIWGRACWSPIEGQACNPLVDPDLMRDLYASWSMHFVDRGFFRQYVYVPADDEAVLDTWFLTGFGKMQAHATRDLSLEPPVDASFTVRRATPDDLERIEPLMDLIATQLVRSPAYAISLPEVLATYRAEYETDLKDPAAHYWVAEENGVAVGLQGLYEAEPGLMVPDGAWELADAKTAPEARGRGVARALLAAAFAEARLAGATHCVTDWRTASLASHRSWMAIGFRPTHFRLHRHIDERISWAGRQPG